MKFILLQYNLIINYEISLFWIIKLEYSSLLLPLQTSKESIKDNPQVQKHFFSMPISLNLDPLFLNAVKFIQKVQTYI